MTKGVIYVLHGRKDRITSANLDVLQRVSDKLTIPSTIGYLEGDHQTLEMAIRELQAQVDDIIFIPVLLFPATHALEDLPQRIAATLDKHKPFSIAPTLATSQAIIDFYIAQTKHALLEYPTYNTLIIAHGTPHYDLPHQQLVEICQKISQHVPCEVFCANHHGQHTYQEFLSTYDAPLMIQPLFLTNGYLVNKIFNNIHQLRGDKDVYLSSLEGSEALYLAILERISAYVSNHVEY